MFGDLRLDLLAHRHVLVLLGQADVESIVAAAGAIEGLLAQLDLKQRRVAVAVNRDVVPRGEYSMKTLGSGDQVEILEAVGGG